MKAKYGGLPEMRKHLHVMCGVFLLCFFAASSQLGISGQNQQGRTLQVQIHYAGAGTVDATHRIFVALWASGDVMGSSGPPVAVQSTDSKNGMVTFSGVQQVPAYVSAAYDPSGKWDAQSGPPPAGSSLGMVSKAPPKPDPIDIGQGKTVKVTLSFDDSIKAQ
jgi:hypothetical protein